MEVSFIGGGSHSIQRKPSICPKSQYSEKTINLPQVTVLRENHQSAPSHSTQGKPSICPKSQYSERFDYWEHGHYIN
jgi:hypothetical protein